MSCGPLPINKYFNFNSKCYTKEKGLYQHFISEMINMVGVKTEYYVVPVSTTNNKLMGEDNNRKIIHKFPIMLYFELPEDHHKYVTGTIISEDIIKAYVSTPTFKVASTRGMNDLLNQMPPMKAPKRGHLVRPTYNGTFYEIIDSIDTEQQFMQEQNYHAITLRVYVDNKIDIDPALVPDMPEAAPIINRPDTFDQTKIVNDEKPKYTLEPKKQNSIFGSW